jgi:hypothetical protein
MTKFRQLILCLHLLWALVTFILAGLFKLLVLDFAGLFIVPFVIWRREVLEDVTGQRAITTVPRSEWCWLWANDEDGCYPLKAIQLHPSWPKFWQCYAWLALRNRTDNLQFTWWCPPSIPERVWWVWLPWKWSKGGFICGQGLLCYVWTPTGSDGSAISFGWNRYPADKVGLKDTDPRRFGCGFGYRRTPKGGHIT